MARSLAKKKRFTIFKRDNFTCMYCGQRPPQVTLEVDHIKPVCEGGTDDDCNLITSCFACNSGKSGEPLEVMPEPLSDTQARRLEALEQAEALLIMERNYRALIIGEIDEIEVAFGFRFDATCRARLVIFVQQLGADVVADCIGIAHSRKGFYTYDKIESKDPGWRYFCGVISNKLKAAGME